MFKKVLSLVLAVTMLCSLSLAFTSCGGGEDELKGVSESPLPSPELVADFDVPENFKIGAQKHSVKSLHFLTLLLAE